MIWNRKKPCSDHLIVSERAPTDQDVGVCNSIWIHNIEGNGLNPVGIYFHNGTTWILYFHPAVRELLEKRIKILQETQSSCRENNFTFGYPKNSDFFTDLEHIEGRLMFIRKPKKDFLDPVE